MEVTKVVNLVGLRQMFYRIDPLIPLEEIIIESYSSISTVEKNTLDIVIQQAINFKFNTTGKTYKFNALSTFYNSKVFVHKAKHFMGVLSSVLFRQFDPYFNKIEAVKVISKSDDKYEVEFKAEYL